MTVEQPGGLLPGLAPMVQLGQLTGQAQAVQCQLPGQPPTVQQGQLPCQAQVMQTQQSCGNEQFPSQGSFVSGNPFHTTGIGAPQAEAGVGHSLYRANTENVQAMNEGGAVVVGGLNYGLWQPQARQSSPHS